MTASEKPKTTRMIAIDVLIMDALPGRMFALIVWGSISQPETKINGAGRSMRSMAAGQRQKLRNSSPPGRHLLPSPFPLAGAPEPHRQVQADIAPTQHYFRGARDHRHLPRLRWRRTARLLHARRDDESLRGLVPPAGGVPPACGR